MGKMSRGLALLYYGALVVASALAADLWRHGFWFVYSIVVGAICAVVFFGVLAAGLLGPDPQ